jgi:hypothetical protein
MSVVDVSGSDSLATLDIFLTAPNVLLLPQNWERPEL